MQVTCLLTEEVTAIIMPLQWHILQVLGYDARVACGAITAKRDDICIVHMDGAGKISNAWKMLDCSMQRAHTNKFMPGHENIIHFA